MADYQSGSIGAGFDWFQDDELGAMRVVVLPDEITSIAPQDGKLIVTTKSGIYEILLDGSFIGVTVPE